ncbi:MAG: hypothetical protein ONB44_01930 [candidate division KSB1 bacterium]|nr:hypothetical protein [candidate division KSB1 bacterium]MDZ7300881.1 hypothetical protein [candidate division KSB1 bacterium]MDZ7309849.1 hypothetical protein [candidate division KSB1 bacterium]
MAKMFSRYAGVVQLVIGLLSQLAPQIGSILGQTPGGGIAGGGNLFNIISGAVLSYLGFGASANAQRTGAQVMGGLNGLVGILGALGVNNVGGFQMTEGWGSIVVNLLVGAWGLYSGFKKSAGATGK